MRHPLKNSRSDGLMFNGHRLTGLMLLLIAVNIAALPSLAQFTPSNRGLPGRREGGGTRGSCPQQRPGLTALIPESNLGKTLAPDPTLFWYVPQNQAGAAEFVLLGHNNVEIYKTQVQVPTQASIVSITLPQDQQLALDRPYRWFFSLICDPLDRSSDSFTSGWVERVEVTAELSNALAASAAADVPNLYAKAGLWQDALTALAHLHQTKPEDPAVLAQWQALLKSVGLEALTSQPIPAVDQP